LRAHNLNAVNNLEVAMFNRNEVELTLTMAGVAYDDPTGEIETDVTAIHDSVKVDAEGFVAEVTAFARAVEEAGYKVSIDSPLAAYLTLFGESEDIVFYAM
jgi:hypothetical protein